MGSDTFPFPFIVELRSRALRTVIAMASGAYRTSLISYFTHRDLFPSLMKVRRLLPPLGPMMEVMVASNPIDSLSMTLIPLYTY